MVLEPKLRVEQSPVRMWSEVRSGGSQYRAGFLRIPINLGSPLDRARKRWMQEVHVEQAQRASFKKQHFSQDPKDWIQAWKARVGESENGNQACGSCDRKGPRVSGKQKGSRLIDSSSTDLGAWNHKNASSHHVEGRKSEVHASSRPRPLRLWAEHSLPAAGV